MCDYSLHTYPNRLAADGEDLIVHRFGAGSLGLASPADLPPLISASKPHRSIWARFKEQFQTRNSQWEAEKRTPAVCVPPGARLMLRDIPKSLQRDLHVGEAEEVEFVETTADVNTYRDAVRFKNGREVLLQQLREGQRVSVLSVASEETEPLRAVWAASEYV
ncbi:MAG: hypothetical protein JOZ32_08945 [Bryobacterales bacterium]|nr:hypothetical protein [Bryobacterales bacterium]